jgi:hypothetical protein
MTRDSSRKLTFFIAAALAAALVCTHGVRAQDAQPPAQPAMDCATDVKTMQEHRMKLIDEFNQMAKSHGGKLDPIESCPKLKVLSTVDASFKAYLVKNKDWCDIPEDAINNVTQSQAKTAALATRVCNVAEQVKKQQSQQAAGGPGAAAPVRLPTGPL